MMKNCHVRAKLFLNETFQNNKALGNDGIPVEFYKIFWPLISEPFIKCVNECFENKELSSSQKQAVITLIEKKGKDQTLLENWRPISMTTSRRFKCVPQNLGSLSIHLFKLLFFLITHS